MSDMTEEFVSEDCDTSTLNTDDVRREIEQFSTGKKLPDQGTMTIILRRSSSPSRRFR